MSQSPKITLHSSKTESAKTQFYYVEHNSANSILPDTGFPLMAVSPIKHIFKKSLLHSKSQMLRLIYQLFVILAILCLTTTNHNNSSNHDQQQNSNNNYDHNISKPILCCKEKKMNQSSILSAFLSDICTFLFCLSVL